VDSKDNLVTLMNNLVQEWGRLKYNKDNITISFAYEGHFKDLLVLGTCHYYGNIVNDKGDIKTEIKGIEMKRASSTRYEASFQEELIKKVLAGEDRSTLDSWVLGKKDEIKKADIQDIAFPSRVAFEKTYKNIPVFLRAISNTQRYYPEFSLKAGDNYFYIYVDSLGKDENKKHINVLAFTKDRLDIIEAYKDKIDWKEVTRRNIDSKVDGVYEAMGWVQTTQIASTLSGSLGSEIDALF